MYSRIRVRLPSARQGGEQYTGGLFRIAPAWNVPPQTRHLAVRIWPGGRGEGRDDDDAGEVGAAEAAAMAALRRRAVAFFRHRAVQYRTERLGVSNARPHSLHRVWCVRATSMSAFFPHRVQ